MNNTLAIGMDTGGTRTKSGLVDLVTGKVLHSMVQPTEKANSDIFLEQAGNVIRYFRTLAAKEQRGIAGIGIGVPGFTLSKALGISETFQVGGKVTEVNA